MNATVTPSIAGRPAAPTRPAVGVWPYFVLLLVLGAAGYSFYRLATPATGAQGPYAAIAYSESTGEYGVSTGCRSFAEAERIAIERCGKPDAHIAVWTHGASCALAVAEDKKFGTGVAPNAAEAEKRALAHCREHTSASCRVAVSVTGTGAEVQPEEAGETGTFAAIAYSRSTGLSGSAEGCASLAEAEYLALKACPAADAKVVTWAHGAWCALAVAEDRAFGYAWAKAKETAEKLAMEHCSHYARTPYKVAACVYGGGDGADVPLVLTPGSGPSYDLKLVLFPTGSKKLVDEMKESAFFSITMEPSGGGELLNNYLRDKQLSTVLTVLEPGGGRPLNYRVHFTRASLDVEGKQSTLPYQGRDVDFTWDGSKYTVGVQGEPLPEKDVKDLELIANTPRLESVLSPGRPVKVGETWSIPTAYLQRALGPNVGLDESSSRAFCRLAKVFDRDGHRFGVLQVTCQVAVNRIDSLRFDPPVSGTWTGALQTPLDGSSPIGTFTQDLAIRGPAPVGKGPGTTQFHYKSREDRWLGN